MVPLVVSAALANELGRGTKERDLGDAERRRHFGGIYSGVFTPTEAAGVAVVYSLFVAMVIYREIDLAGLWQVIVSSIYLIAQILIIVTGAGVDTTTWPRWRT